jgi:hypothetical protein
MRGLLDDERLTGAHEARIAYRPERVAVPLPAPLTAQGFIDVVRAESQVWGGAVAPFIPVTPGGKVEDPYARILPGSQVDGLRGLHPFNLSHLSEATVETRERPHGQQLAFTLLESGKAEQYRPVQVAELDPEDPWSTIYAACLGLLPVEPNPEMLRQSNLIPDLTFEKIIRVDRCTIEGSLDDLVQRLSARDVLSPRKLSMLHLSYGNSGSTAIRTGHAVLPEPKLARHDAGPNVVVICSAHDVRDAALLWNLRGAFGDSSVLPIGVLADEVTPDRIRRLLRDPGITRNGLSFKSAYLTSASLSVAEISELVGTGGANDRIGIASYEEMLDLGSPGSIARNEVLVWDNGRTGFVPLPADIHRDLFSFRPLAPILSMHADVDVFDAPFPSGADVRASVFSHSFHGGRYSASVPPGKRSAVRDLAWPSTLLMARTVAASRGFELKESEPGRAARVLLAGLGGISNLGNLAHAPLLSMLEEMAARQGFGWYKDRMRQVGQQADPLQSVGPTTDELPEKTFHEFKKVFRNRDKATKNWLLWAEQSNLILKGFQLVCTDCDAKQWIPVAGFAPPIICRGCAREMSTPFGDRSSVEFRYRISERLRRVYEQDAMGHLLVARFFHLLFKSGKSGRLIGLHPGIEALRKGGSSPEGEADVMLFTKDSTFVPIEVKRTSAGFIDREIEKLDHLAKFVDAPWSAVVACQYGSEVGSEFPDLARKTGSGYSRIVLSYDKLLEAYPMWALGSDPFAWDPMSPEGVDERELKFVTRLADSAGIGEYDWLSDELLNQPGKVD